MKFYLISLFVVAFYGWTRTSADELSVCKTLDIKPDQIGSLKNECRSQTLFLEDSKPGPKGDVGPQGPQGPAGPRGDKGETGLTSNCLGINYMFPRTNQNQDYVRYRAYVPSMKEVTVCAWVVSKNTKHVGSIMSYATSRHDNELLFDILPWRVAVYTGSVVKILPLPTKISTTQSGKFHLCVQVSSIKEKATLFINGAQSSTVKSKFNSIVGGGSLILGQDQDKVNARGLSASDSMTGNVQGLMIWPRLLTNQEINNIATKCVCPQDYSVVMTMDRSELFGMSSYKLPDQCPALQN